MKDDRNSIYAMTCHGFCLPNLVNAIKTTRTAKAMHKVCHNAQDFHLHSPKLVLNRMKVVGAGDDFPIESIFTPLICS